MALVLNDRVKETSTSTGTGTIDLDGAVTGFETFVAGIATGNTTYYAIFLQGSTEWEVGLGTVTDATPDTLARTTVITSSNSDSAVNFSAGTKDVFCTLPASKAVYLDASGAAVGAISNVVEDTTPQLGGDLDVNGNAIVSASDGDIAINANGTGMVTMTANSVAGDVIPGKLAGTNFSGGLIVGHSTTGTLSTATYNTGVGLGAMDAITSADYNTCVGYNAGSTITTSPKNTFIGRASGFSTATGSGANTYVGQSTAYFQGNGQSNTAVGVSALQGSDGASSGNYNNAFGRSALDSVTSGEYNIGLGYTSGNNITSGSGNVVLGVADVSSATGDDQLSISDGEDGAVVWLTGDSSGTVSANGGELTTTGKAFVMGF